MNHMKTSSSCFLLFFKVYIIFVPLVRVSEAKGTGTYGGSNQFMSKKTFICYEPREDCTGWAIPITGAVIIGSIILILTLLACLFFCFLTVCLPRCRSIDPNNASSSNDPENREKRRKKFGIPRQMGSFKRLQRNYKFDVNANGRQDANQQPRQCPDQCPEAPVHSRVSSLHVEPETCPQLMAESALVQTLNVPRTNNDIQRLKDRRYTDGPAHGLQRGSNKMFLSPQPPRHQQIPKSQNVDTLNVSKLTYNLSDNNLEKISRRYSSYV